MITYNFKNNTDKGRHTPETVEKMLSEVDSAYTTEIGSSISLYSEENLPKIQAEWDKTDEALEEAIAEYGKLKAKASDFDKDELDRTRKSLRADKESEARKKIQAVHGNCDDQDFDESKEYIEKRIGEYDEPPQKEAEIQPVNEALPQEPKERKSPSKSTRERDGGDR